MISRTTKHVHQSIPVDQATFTDDVNYVIVAWTVNCFVVDHILKEHNRNLARSGKNDNIKSRTASKIGVGGKPSGVVWTFIDCDFHQLYRIHYPSEGPVYLN